METLNDEDETFICIICLESPKERLMCRHCCKFICPPCVDVRIDNMKRAVYLHDLILLRYFVEAFRRSRTVYRLSSLSVSSADSGNLYLENGFFNEPFLKNQEFWKRTIYCSSLRVMNVLTVVLIECGKIADPIDACFRKEVDKTDFTRINWLSDHLDRINRQPQTATTGK